MKSLLAYGGTPELFLMPHSAGAKRLTPAALQA
jgi:hypothetical protein